MAEFAKAVGSVTGGLYVSGASVRPYWRVRRRVPDDKLWKAGESGSTPKIPLTFSGHLSAVIHKNPPP